jgi:hypothetical protein
MSRTWVYLKQEEYNMFKLKAESLNMTENELTQFLIRLFLHTPTDSKPNVCVNCQYYLIATSGAIQALMKLNEAFSLVTPEYMRKRKS